MKIKIALRNLIISQALIFIFLVFAYLFWFPYSFAHLGGFFDTAWMIIFVDLILGPLLVYFIYKENKKHLTFDINVLLSIQLIAFVFGAYSLFLKHPAYAVFSVDRFVLTNVSNIYPQPSWFHQAKKHFFSSPKLMVAQLPVDPKERNSLTLNVILNNEPDLGSRPKYFSPLDTHLDQVMQRSLNIEQLLLTSNEEEELRLFKSKHKESIEKYSFFPLTGNNKKDMIWVLDTKGGTPVAILKIDPWKLKISAVNYDK